MTASSSILVDSVTTKDWKVRYTNVVQSYLINLKVSNCLMTR